MTAGQRGKDGRAFTGYKCNYTYVTFYIHSQTPVVLKKNSSPNKLDKYLQKP